MPAFVPFEHFALLKMVSKPALLRIVLHRRTAYCELPRPTWLPPIWGNSLNKCKASHRPKSLRTTSNHSSFDSSVNWRSNIKPDRLQTNVQRVAEDQRKSQIKQQRFADRIQLDAVAADRLGTSMNPEFHYQAGSRIRVSGRTFIGR